MKISGSDLDPLEQHSNGYTAKEERNNSFFLLSFFLGGEVTSEFGVSWVAVVSTETSMAVDAEELGLGKETESIMKKLGSEWRQRQTECACGKGSAEAILHEKFPPKNLTGVLHISEELQTTATPISPRCPAFLPVALPLPASIYVYMLDPHANNIR